MKAKIHVNTTVVGSTVEQRMDLQIGEGVQHLSTQAIDMSEASVRQALISLGWTPPKEQPAQQQEPVAWTDEQLQMLNFLYGAGDFDGVWFDQKHPTEEGTFWWRQHLRRLFTSPPANANAGKPWVGLTLEDKRYLNEVLNLQGRFPVIEAIESKLKEKNT